MTEINNSQERPDQEWIDLLRGAMKSTLAPLEGPGFCIGYVDEVNGEGATEIQGFTPTLHELTELLKYWVKVAIDLDYEYFVYSCWGSDLSRLYSYAECRVAQIKELLGKRARPAVEEAYREFGSTVDKRCWEIFMHGTEEQRSALQDEIRREMSGTTGEDRSPKSETNG